MFLLAVMLVSSFVSSAEVEIKVPAGQLRPFWVKPKAEDAKLQPVFVGEFFAQPKPVTNQEWIKFIRAYPEWKKSSVRRIFADQAYLSQFESDYGLKKDIRMDSPVTYVSWFAARAYCNAQKMRLPLLSEWEYMAAANSKMADATKDPEFLRTILEWYSRPKSKDGLARVGQRKPNIYGLYDLHGLIWEWVEDFNSNLITGESRSDGSIDRDLFCGAGGMSGGDKENYAAFMRFAFRSSLKGNTTTWNLGFRCVRDGVL